MFLLRRGEMKVSKNATKVKRKVFESSEKVTKGDALLLTERVQRGDPYTKRMASAPDFESSLVIILRSPRNSGFVATPSSFSSTNRRTILSFAPGGPWRDKWRNPPLCVVPT